MLSPNKDAEIVIGDYGNLRGAWFGGTADGNGIETGGKGGEYRSQVHQSEDVPEDRNILADEHLAGEGGTYHVVGWAHYRHYEGALSRERVPERRPQGDAGEVRWVRRGEMIEDLCYYFGLMLIASGLIAWYKHDVVPFETFYGISASSSMILIGGGLLVAWFLAITIPSN